MLAGRRARRATVVRRGAPQRPRGASDIEAQPWTRAIHERRVEDLGLGGQVGRLGPDRVEALHADLVDGGAHEDGAVAVLRHLLVQPQQPAQQPVERADALAALGELARGSSATLGITSGPTPSITTSAWPSSRLITPVTRSMTAFCSGVENRSSRLPSALPETRSPTLADRVAEQLGRGRSAPSR